MSLLGLLLVLAAMALVGLRPWETDSVVPSVTVPPGLGAALDDSVELAPAPRQAVADAEIPVSSGHVAVVSRPAPAAPERGAGPVLAVSQGRAVSQAVPAQPSQPPVEPSPSPPVPAAAPVAAPQPAPAPTPVSAPTPILVADFENGLLGWSTSGEDDAVPVVSGGIVREGGQSSLIRLTGDQSSSQLTFGGDGGESGAGAVQIHEGDEYAFAFSLYIQRMVYGEPGVDNLIMQLKSDASEVAPFGLQLWDSPEDGALRGLWSSGEAVGGERFLAPIPERTWHDVIVHFKASSQGAGFYTVYLDRELVDARDGVSTIAPGSSYAQIEVGLFRDGELLQGTSEIRLDAAKLGTTPESVLP